MTEEQANLITGALDSLACALSDHEHEWTHGERTIYDMAVECVRKPGAPQVSVVTSSAWLAELEAAHAIVVRLLATGDKELNGLAMWVALAQAEADISFALSERRR